MKRYIKSTRDGKLNEEHFTIARSGVKFSVRAKVFDDPDQFQFEVYEIHPYDEADYAWAKKVSPTMVNIYRDGRRISAIPVPEYDDEGYEGEYEYYNEVLDITYLALIEANKDVEPMMSYN